MLDCIEIETSPKPDFAVIWLHGLGADGSDFVPIVPQLGLPSRVAVRFVFPHAPAIPVSSNGGMVMRAWYDILSFDNIERHADEGGIRASRDAVRELIARENERGIATQRIVLAGFSQGGAMAYTAGLTHADTLAGIVALSAYIPAPALLMAEAGNANRATPIFAAHGTADEVVPYQLGAFAAKTLAGFGYRVDWRDYPMPHAVCDEEIAALGQWIAERMGRLQ